MVDYQELMDILSVPRPNGSPALRKTADALRDWMDRHELPYRRHFFTLYPYYFESIGLWIIISRTLLSTGIWLRWGWAAALIAAVGLLGGLLDSAFHIPCVSWPGKSRGENLILTFEPAQAHQEIVLSAHYDSKTELLDHRQRMFLLKSLRFGIFISVLLGLLGPLDVWLLDQGSPWAAVTYWTGVLVTLPLMFLSWALGLNLTIGRFLTPSQGAVDNGAACAILLGLAERLKQGSSPAGAQPVQSSGAPGGVAPLNSTLQNTRVTLAIFAGEEVNLQGSRAYASERKWPLPAVAVNLEVMAQDGRYVFWELDGSVFRLVPTSASLNQAVAQAVEQVTREPACPTGPVISDGASFLAAGIPATTLGTVDTEWGDTGFHRPSDHLGRVRMERIPEGVEILYQLIENFDRGRVEIDRDPEPAAEARSAR